MPTNLSDTTPETTLGEGFVDTASDSAESDSKKGYMDWVILFFIGLSSMGPILALESGAVLELQLLNLLGISQGTWNMLNSFKAFCIIPMPIFGGLLIDSIGYRKILVVAMFGVVIGQIVTTIAIHINSLVLFVLGGLIYGLLFDATIIASTTFVSKMFFYKELALAVAFLGIFQKASGLISNLLLPYLYGLYGLTACWVLSVFVAIGSWFCAIIAAYLDYRKHKSMDTSDNHVYNKKFNLRDLKKIPKIVWILSCSSSFAIIAFMSLLGNMNAILQDKFGLDVATAGDAVTILTPVSFIITLGVGFFLDRFGLRPKVIILSEILLILACLGFQVLSPCEGCYSFLPPLILLGCYSGCSIITISSSLPFLIDMKKMGMGFGASTVLINLLSIFTPLILGGILDIEQGPNGYQGYTGAFWFFVVLGCIGFTFSLILNKYDQKHGKPLSQARPNASLLSRMSIVSASN